MAAIRVPQSALPDLALVATHAAKLPLFSQILDELGSKLQTVGLREEFSQRAGIPLADVSKILDRLSYLLSVCEREDKTVDAVLSEFTAHLEKIAAPEWKSEHLDRWRLAIPNIRAALDPDGPLAIYYRTLAQTYGFQNVLYESRIYTELRPIFNSAESDILRAVVTHMLALRYAGNDISKSIYFAMDSTDVFRLQKACEQALKRADVIKKGLSSLPWSTEIAGEKE